LDDVESGVEIINDSPSSILNLFDDVIERMSQRFGSISDHGLKIIKVVRLGVTWVVRLIM